MSRLEELIAELCPEGVEYKTLGEIASVSRGGSFQKKDFRSSGVPCIHYGQIYTKYGLFVDKALTYIDESCAKKQKFAKTNDIVMAVTSENIEDVCKCIVWLGDERAAVSGHTAIIHHNQNAKYLAYYFHTQMFFAQKRKIAHGTKVVEVTPSKLLDIRIPVPPLPVQGEIVRILDNFTELTAELTARKKQYEYYRDRFLHFTCNTKKYVLGDIATVTKLAGFEFTKYVKYSNEGQIIALRGLNIKNGKLQLDDVKYIDHSDLTKLSRSKLHIGDMLFTYVGTIGQVALIDEEDKYYLAPNVALIRCDKRVLLPEYMRYYFQSNLFWDKQINRLLQSSSMKNIPMEKIRKFEIVAPSLEVQKRFVDVLDHFDAVCSDLKIGLPAEIEARKKQYEYYRDQLLTFAESGRMLVDRQTDRQTECD